MGGALVLGPVVFQGFEIPARLQFGGRQRLVLHELPGGGRVVDAMGAEEEPVAWSGIMSGPDAAERVRVLERLRRSGAALPLSWEGWLFSVVIESFEVEAMNPAWIPYKLRTCVVPAGDVAGNVADALLAGVASTFGGVTGSAAQIAAASGLLTSNDPAVAMAAAGSLAQLVAGNALAGLGGGA